ncbi:helix-turn-helix domain-containing protein [Cryobacterium algoritolerans]|uniref:Helix-turn-helix domain-containing protein n=1 Tax=Cryobacterium algoritolerans TaxID=1259184 RepID=A0A4R8WX82_9MICO|nr:helix-turn-helix domain-containing protein [Cryobacterium algoritolerans]TFC20065.1 helix-turn-helix domain-containing protein [Cryobacterium algoritolerans]
MRHAASPGALLEDAIRQIVREEVRAALADAERIRGATTPVRAPRFGSGPQALTPEDVSAKTGVAVQTLYNWRHLRKGPRSFKLGRLVRYFESDVDEWIAAQPRKLP